MIHRPGAAARLGAWVGIRVVCRDSCRSAALGSDLGDDQARILIGAGIGV